MTSIFFTEIQVGCHGARGLRVRNHVEVDTSYDDVNALTKICVQLMLLKNDVVIASGVEVSERLYLEMSL